MKTECRVETGKGREETKNPQPPRRPRAPGPSGKETLRAYQGRRCSSTTRSMGQQGRVEVEDTGSRQACKQQTLLATLAPGPSTERAGGLSRWRQRS